jgi:N utilization substance protein A
MQENVDPVGSCIGQRGSRIQTVISELGGEKVDIITWDEDRTRFIGNALSPAKVLRVLYNPEMKTARVLVAADQLSLAIGRGGQNVHLAARLTDSVINIVEEEGEAPSASSVEEAPNPSVDGEVVAEEGVPPAAPAPTEAMVPEAPVAHEQDPEQQ